MTYVEEGKSFLMTHKKEGVLRRKAKHMNMSSLQVSNRLNESKLKKKTEVIQNQIKV